MTRPEQIFIIEIMKIIFVLLTTILVSSNAMASRLQKHEIAAETFTNWHFFENGRGMTISPNISKFMWMLGDDPRSEKERKADFVT